MPTFLAPHKSGAHRTAAIALYRALLSQSSKLLNSPEKIQDIIRAKFKEQRYNTSTRRLKVYFTAGYEAVDLLDGAVVGGVDERVRIGELVESAREVSEKRRAKAAIGAGKKDVEEERTLKNDKINMLSRPLPREKLTGKRKVPVLVDAGHIPILRFTKPQPQALSSYLTSRIKQRQRRHDRRLALEDALVLAREEDRWDGIVDQARSEHGGQGQPERGKSYGGELIPWEPFWSRVPYEALKDVNEALQKERDQNQAWAEKLQGIVDRESDAFEREKREEEDMKKGDHG